MIAFKIFPEKKYVISTHLSWTEIQNKLQEQTEEYKPLINPFKKHKPFQHVISAYGFELYRRTQLDNRGDPLICFGTVEENAYGCDVEIQIYPSEGNKLTSIFIYTIAAIAFLVLLFHLRIEALIPLFIAAFIYLVSMGQFNATVSDYMLFLDKLLEKKSM